MLLGKRPRPQMRRTTSMTEFTVDLGKIDGIAVKSNAKDPKDLQKMGVENSTRKNTDGFDPSYKSMVSPRNPSRRSSADFLETAPFLRACGLCKRRLGPGRDIYMYRGETAFCSLECRQQQMNQDERKEKCSLTSIKKDPASTTGSDTASNGERVAAA